MKPPSFLKRGPGQGAFDGGAVLVAAKLASTVPEQSRKQEVQDARLAAASLYTLVGNSADTTPAIDTIAGALLEYAALAVEAERSHILREAKVQTLGEIAALRRALAATEEALVKLVQQMSF